jgi:DNA-binding beta-propeller fold protein YncE
MVTDANGDPILNPPLTFTSSNPGLVAVTDYSYVTSVSGNGTAILTVVSGTLSTTVTVTVMQVPTTILVTPTKDEQTLFVGTEYRLEVIDVPSESVVNDNLASGSVNAISRAPGSHLLYAVVNGSTIVEIDGTSRAILRTSPVLDGALQETAASLDGTELYVVQEAGDLIVWDLASNQLKQRVPGAGGFGLGFSPDGKFLYVASSYGGEIRIIDRVSRVVLHTIVAGARRAA